MAGKLINTGALLLLISLATLMFLDMYFGININNIAKLGILTSAVMICAGILMRVLEKSSSLFKTTRCAKCGKKIPYGHIYCDKHTIETIDEINSGLKK